MSRVAVTRGRARGFDLAAAPILGRFINWKHARTSLQIVLLFLAGLIIFDGLVGPSLAPKNLAGVLPWVHWRGFVVLALLVFGNLFCMACPFMLTRNLGRRFLPGDRAWPSWLPGKWLAVGLLLVFFWAYEAFDLWASPWLTAWVVLAYFAAAFAIDGFFKGAAFCKHVCPIGQFHFVNSLASPFEVRVREPSACQSCLTKDCISGRRDPESGRLQQNGCELWLFQERKYGNMDCTFCLDCVHACPYDNVGVIARNPVIEFKNDPNRSGVGRLSGRPDIAALVLVLVFGAFLNAFGMVGPVYDFERWLANTLGLSSEATVLLLVFGVGLVLLPLVLVGWAGWVGRHLAGDDRSLVTTVSRFSIGLVPLGFAMWLAHYGFHFFTGALTIIPVAHSFLIDIGVPGLGEPNWELAEILPLDLIDLFELVVLQLGLLGTILALRRVSLDWYATRRKATLALIPWAMLAVLLFVAGLWLMSQPMEMRGTVLG